jgi:hypothetical protein
MASIKTNDIRNGLIRKGFVQDNRHHKYYIMYVDGVKTKVRTRISHGESEINDALINKMKKQVHLSKEDFFRLVECPLSKEGYIEILIREGTIRLS